ncbi:putative porin [Fulvivirga sediminis]|uniref:Porin n=1 Tax=Fulvivirga sediminis TaxID=2803949 RepID=A0A937F5C2_9BACT|nr:putative porin [Fulvivirga sediminis]MBL3655306.1 hypothetical protein [Fulvivirga sediminis]
MQLRSIFILLLLFTVSIQGFGQIEIPEEERKERVGSEILDDSTKQIYGPTTTRYTLEENIKFNIPHYWTIDTSVYNMHKYQFTVKEDNLYQNLGNIGTAARPIYPTLPTQIGATSGFNIYDLYYRGPDQIRYYDTKSPYSNLGVTWGGQGRAVTEVTYARNIDERAGIGFDFRGLYIDKQILRVRRGDRNVEGTYYTGYGHYKTRNGRYQLLANFIRNRHNVDEYGGIFRDDVTTNGVANQGPEGYIYFDEDKRQTVLAAAETDELRTNYHLYHQYQLTNYLQVYHQYDRYKQQNDFIDDESQEDRDLRPFDNYIDVGDTVNVKDRSKLVYRQHELGVKGDIGKGFYTLYYKARDVDFQYKYLTGISKTDYLENYAGFNLRFGNDSISYVKAYGEYKLGGEYKVGGEIRNSWFFAEGYSTKYLPGYIQRAYLGRHDEWNESFDSPISSRISAGLNVKVGDLRVKPSAEYNLLTNYIYFNQDTLVDEGEQRVLPEQASADISIVKAKLELNYDFGKGFNFNGLGIYSNVSGGSAGAINVPRLFGNAQISYHDISFEGNLEWQVGFDVHWHSSYYANGYDPVIMQYYTQSYFKVPDFPVVDFFVNAKINRGRFFLKYNNIVELFRDRGYFATPYYIGQTSIFDFGFKWAFYD